MGEVTRVLFENLRRTAERRRFYRLYRERGYFVLHHRLTGVKRYYARLADIWRLLA